MIPGLPPLVILETITMPSDAASVTIPASGSISDHANFPAGSRHVVVLFSARNSNASTGDIGLNVRVNADSNTKYDTVRTDGAVSTVSGFKESGQTSWTNLCALSGDSQDAGFYSPGTLLFPHAFGTDNFTAVVSMNGIGEQRSRQGVGQWEDTSAITSVSLHASTDNLEAGTIIQLCVVDESYLVSSGEEILSSNAAFADVTVPAQAGDISLIAYGRTTNSGSNDGVAIELNGDTTASNYTRQYLFNQVTTVTAGQSTSNNQIGSANGNNSDTNHFSPILASISQHNNGDDDPHVLCISGLNSVSTADSVSMINSARRNNVAAVTSARIVPTVASTWLSGSGQWVYAVPKLLLERKTLGASATSVVFTLSESDIPTATRDLRLHVYARSDEVSAYDWVRITFNSDTTDANYNKQEVYGIGSTTGASSSAANRRVGIVGSGSSGTDVFGGFTVHIPNYKDTSFQKHYLCLSGASHHIVDLVSGRWESTAEITTITLTLEQGDDFIAGSIFELEAVGSLDPNSDNYVRQRLEASSTNVTAHEVAAA